MITYANLGKVTVQTAILSDLELDYRLTDMVRMDNVSADFVIDDHEYGPWRSEQECTMSTMHWHFRCCGYRHTLRVLQEEKITETKEIRKLNLKQSKKYRLTMFIF